MARSLNPRSWRTRMTLCALVISSVCYLAAGAAAQEKTDTVPALSTAPSLVSPLPRYLAPPSNWKLDSPTPIRLSTAGRWNPGSPAARLASGAGPRRITLEEAQEQAAAANNPMLRLATLGVEAAKQHRLGVQSDFFPKVSSTFANLHFNKFMGETVLIRRPVLGDVTVAVPLVYKDETLVVATATQPITPLFKLYQVLRIARADERVARAKAGEPAAEVASNVEQSFFGLLVAQRQREAAGAKLKQVESKWLLASASAPPAGLGEHEAEWIEADKALVLANSKVKEATVALNSLLGWPADTELDPVIPAAFSEHLSVEEAVADALKNNPEVIEAEQTLVKAQAGSKLSKLDYLPDVAVTGGYSYQNLIPILPRDFSYVGVVASYNLFDFGKRERTVKERNAQVAMAETGLQLVKAKVAAAVAKAFIDLDRARELSALARRMNSASETLQVKDESVEARTARARVEAEMLQAELEYRQAYSRLQLLIGAGGLSLKK